MHILEIPSFFPPYGGLFCLDQSKALASLGHEVRIVANVQLSVKRSLKDYLFAATDIRETVMDGITVLRHEMRGWPKVVRPNARRWVAQVRQMAAQYIAVYGRPDVLHAHCTNRAGYAAMLIGRDYGIPYIITEHLSSMIYRQEFGDISPEAAPDSTGNSNRQRQMPWQLPLLRQALHSAAMVIPVSAELVDDLEPYFGRDYRYTALSNTIDTEFFAYRERRPAESGSERPFTFCALGINVPRKAYDILLPAFLLFARRHPEARLIIAGRDTEKLNVRKFSAELSDVRDKTSACSGRNIGMSPHASAQTNIVLAGETDKNGVRDILYRSDCLVLPTRSEAQGLVLLEAMSTGIRTITTEAAPRNVRIEGGCTVVPVDDVRALAEAMEAVYATPFSGGEALSERVAAVCSPRAVGLKLEEILAQAQCR